MKTDVLIDLLARHAGPAPRAAPLRRLVPAALAGLVCSAVAAVALFDAVPAAMFATPAPWIKMAYAGALACAAMWLTARLARPVARLGRPRQAVLAVMGAMALVGAVALGSTPSPLRLTALMGHSWLACPWNVLILSLPGLALALWAVRGLAPTQLRAAGLAAGLLAGALGALGYSLSCTEDSAGFVAVWYTLGIALTAAAGALLGPRVLRW